MNGSEFDEAAELTLSMRVAAVPHLQRCQRSSVVEQQFRKLQVVGSIPTVGSTAYARGFAFTHTL